tara:strand:- start:634 stop:1365 length:732 start_codon:yes stop_codon:yes gene_type:complete
MTTDIKYHSQVGQDKFVLNALKFKTNGFFFEFGSQDPIKINNSYTLEKNFGWTGVMFEWDEKYVPLYEKHRSEDTTFIIADATAINYKEVFPALKVEKELDYLQIDLESGMGTPLELLKKLDEEVLGEYKFATVTFEHDIYCARPNSTDNVGCAENGWRPFDPDNFHKVRDGSREIFEKRGYVPVLKDVKCSKEHQNPFEDWWVHPDLVDMEHIQKIIDMNEDIYEDNDVTGRAISGPHVEYP